MLMILYTKNRENYYLDFYYNKMDAHPFLPFRVHYIFVSILLKIKMVNINGGKCRF